MCSTALPNLVVSGRVVGGWCPPARPSEWASRRDRGWRCATTRRLEPGNQIEQDRAGDRGTARGTTPGSPLAAMRASLRIRNATLYERLAALTAAGVFVRSPDGYRLAGR
jgi:hypothetical protein